MDISLEEIIVHGRHIYSTTHSDITIQGRHGFYHRITVQTRHGWAWLDMVLTKTIVQGRRGYYSLRHHCMYMVDMDTTVVEITVQGMHGYYSGRYHCTW
jgi:hypothetical protein